MTAALLVALATLGQVGGQIRYEPGQLYRSPNGAYILADTSGKPWSSIDPAWLRRYVEGVNATRHMPSPGDKTPNFGLDMGSLQATAPESMRTNDERFGDSFYDSKHHGAQVPMPDATAAPKRDWIQYALLAAIIGLVVFYPRKASNQ